MIQLIAALLIITACTFLAICTGTFKNPFIQLLLAGFMAVILSNETPTPPVMIWSAVLGLAYVLCVDWMAEAIHTRKPTSIPPAPPQTPITQQPEASIHPRFRRVKRV